MQRSSESIGVIAGALAKAQVEIVNPEKSLTALSRQVLKILFLLRSERIQ